MDGKMMVQLTTLVRILDFLLAYPFGDSPAARVVTRYGEGVTRRRALGARQQEGGGTRRAGGGRGAGGGVIVGSRRGRSRSRTGRRACCRYRIIAALARGAVASTLVPPREAV